MNTTATEYRNTGISVVGDVPWGTHFCHFYETKQDLLDTLVPYFKAGLESKEFCVWVVSDSGLITVREAKGVLAQAVPDLDLRLADEDIEILNGLDWYLEENVFNLERVTRAWDAKLKRALARGYDGMRVSGDTFWLAEKDWKDFFAYEKQLNDSIIDQPMTVLCTYPLAKSSAGEVLDVVQAHQFAIARRQGEWEVVETPELIQAKAEIRRLNEELEQRVVERTRELAAANEQLRKEMAERQQAEDALRGSEDRLRLVIDTVPALIHTGLPDGQLDFFNQRWLDFVGLSLEDLSGWKWTAAIHPEDVAAMVERWRAALATGEPDEHAARVRRADGEYRWMVHCEVPLRDERGNIVKWYASSIDIEDRKRVEDALRRSEERFAAFMDNLPGYAWMKDLQGRYVYVNEMVRGLPGYRSLGKTDAQIWPADVAAEYRANDQQVIAAKKPLHTLEHFQLEGKHRYMAGSKFPIFDKTGAVALVGGVGVDITERIEAEEALRESEQLLQLVLATLPVGVGVTDRMGDIVLVNAASKRIWGDVIVSGRERRAQSKGYWHDSGKRIAPTEWASVRAASEGQTSLNELIDIETFDGYRKTIQNSAAPVRNAEGLIVGTVVVNEDVTDRVQAEEALRRSEDHLRLVIDTIPVMAWTVRPDGVVDFLNQRWLDYTGLSLEQYVEDPTGPIHPEDIPRVMERWLVEQAVGEPYEDEMRLRRADGVYRWFLVRTAPLRDKQGDLVKWYGVSTDIEDLKRADAALKETQRRLEEAQRIAHVGHWDRDLETGLITWSDEIYRILGLPMQEGDSPRTEWLDVVHPEDKPRLSLAIEELERGIRRLDVEFRIVRPNGEVRFLHSQGDVIRDERGQPLRRFGTAQDITERRSVEDELKKEKEVLEKIFDNIPVMIGFVGEDGRVKMVNPEWERTIGWTLKELQEQNVDIFTEAYPDPSYRQEILDFVAAATGEWVDLKIRVRDGRVIDAACAVVHLSDGTKVAIAQDITERKEAEQRLKHSETQLAEAQRLANVGGWDWDLRSNTVTWSEELYRIFGLPTGQIKVAGDAMSFIHPEDRDLVRSTRESAVRNKKPYSFHYRVLRPDGDERIVHSRGSVLCDNHGEPIRVFGATQDVTELKRAEERLKETSEQLRALSARLESAREEESTRIARELHDELGAGLSSLRWDLEEVIEVVSQANDLSQFAGLRKRIEAMIELTDTTVNAVRRIASELRPIALDELGLSEAIVWQTQQFQDRTGIIVECDCPLGTIDLSREQSTAVFRMFQEALTNILRHAKATKVNIQMKEEDGEFIFTISDDGRGITDDEKSGKRTLGLLGMRERVRLIGGNIHITGSAGKGTVVTVRIPIDAKK